MTNILKLIEETFVNKGLSPSYQEQAMYHTTLDPSYTFQDKMVDEWSSTDDAINKMLIHHTKLGTHQREELLYHSNPLVRSEFAKRNDLSHEEAKTFLNDPDEGVVWSCKMYNKPTFRSHGLEKELDNRVDRVMKDKNSE